MDKKSVSVQLACLLPSQVDIQELIPSLGSIEHETHGDERQAEGINCLVASIVWRPNDPFRWQALALAFRNEMRWKYLHIAHSLCPEDSGILQDLALTCVLLGDYKQALLYIEQAIVQASEEQLQDVLDSKFRILFWQKSLIDLPDESATVH